MAARGANQFASASPKGSPFASPTKPKSAPASTLTILELGPLTTNFHLRVLVDHIGEVREFGGGRGCILRVQLSDADGLLLLILFLDPHSCAASITGVAFNMVAKFLANTLKVGQV